MKPPHILVVDDEEAIINSLKMVLEESDYQVTTSQSPTQALELFSKAVNDFSLLITDLTMPEMDGISLIREIKKIRNNMPTILLSGYANTNVNQEYIDIFLPKPVGIDELLISIEKLL